MSGSSRSRGADFIVPIVIEFVHQLPAVRSMSRVTHVLFFDIDGTLLRTGGAGQKAMERALVEEFGVDCGFDRILTAGRTDCGIVDEIFARHGLSDTPVERARFRQSYLERLSLFLERNEGGLLPGVVPLLESLAATRGVYLSLLTGNYAEGAWTKLRHFGLDRFFQTGGFGDDHAHRNDVARVARHTVQSHLGIDLSECRLWVIGDTPADIRCGQAIGARTIGVATGVYSLAELEPHAADHLFEDFGEPGDVITRLLGRPAGDTKSHVNERNDALFPATSPCQHD